MEPHTLARYVAWRYRHRLPAGMTYEEAVQVAERAIVAAACTYEPLHGMTFTAWCAMAGRRALRAALQPRKESP